jgi:hypothetical protein
VRVLRRNKDVTLSVHALGVGLAERNASTSKMLSAIVLSLRRPFKPCNPPAQHLPSCSLARPLPSEPLSPRIADPRTEGAVIPANHPALAQPLFEPIRTTSRTTRRLSITLVWEITLP